MAVVHIPRHMRQHSHGKDRVEVPAGTLRSVLDALEDACPGISDVIMDGGRVRSELAIAINSTVTENNLIERIHDDDEIHLIPAIAGG